MLPTLRRSNGSEVHTMGDFINRFMAMEPLLPSWSGRFQPVMDVEETDKEYRVTAECPGMSKEDIQISIENNVLTVSGEKEERKERKEKDLYQSERRYGKFMRTLPLPAQVDAKKITASYRDGVLEISVPKLPGAQAQKIQISSK